jgi:hypothetical protein
MKKIILSIVAVLAFGFANAQSKGGDSSMSFGAKGGLNFATIAGSEGASSLLAFHLGAFAEFKVSDKFAVQPELLYSMQGAKYEGGNINLNYINIPVMAKYFVTDAISINAGPQLGILMSATADGKDVKEGYNTTDFGLNIGGGYNIGDNMMLDLRYNLGFSELQKDKPTGGDANKNAVIQLSFGYKF